MIKRLLGIVLLLVSLQANALDFSIGAGVSQFTADNGTWYQEEFPHKLNLTSSAFIAKIEQSINDKYAINAGYLYLGKTSSDALASASDADHSWPLSNWIGYGDVKGFFLQGKRKFSNGIFIEGGTYYYKATWQEYISDWRACADCATQYVEVSHVPKWKLAPIYGLGYQKDNWSVALQQTWVDADEGSVEGTNFPAVYKKYTTSIFVNYTF